MDEPLSIIGNPALIAMPFKAFLSSRKASQKAAARCVVWAAEARDGDAPVALGAQSELEKDVFKVLIGGSVPVVLVLARGIWDDVPVYLRQPIGEGRLAVVSPMKRTVVRVTRDSAAARNLWLMRHASEIVFGTLDSHGSLVRLMGTLPPKPFRVLAD